MPDPQKQRLFAVDVVQRLQGAGLDACFAGGCVRDQLLGREPKDYDIATAAKPQEVRELFGPRRTLPIGAAFGVITVIGPRGAGQVDVATFRQDGGYSDGRHPDQVTYSSAEEDARRRDFTINGMFFDPVAERVIDYVGGQADLARGVVRAIGDPQTRFSEDKLRMLRAVRFAATLAFELDHDTAAAIRQMAGQLTVVSSERIAHELERMLTDAHRLRALQLLRDTNLAEELLGDVATRDEEAWDRGLRTADRLTAPSFALALAAVLGTIADTAVAAELAQRLRLSNNTQRRLAWLMKHRNEPAGAADKPWSKLQPLLVHPGASELVALAEARAAIGELSTGDEVFCRERLAWPRDQLDPAPLLTGDDLARHGVPQGAIYARLLTATREAQLDGQIRTRDEALALVDRLRA